MTQPNPDVVVQVPPLVDTQTYIVAYFNGVTEEVVGLEQVRRLLLTPELRAEGADPRQGGTYAVKR